MFLEKYCETTNVHMHACMHAGCYYSNSMHLHSQVTGESNVMKVLRRLTKPRADGSYLVPEEIVQKFKDHAGGGRAEVLELFEKSNLDKDQA